MSFKQHKLKQTKISKTTCNSITVVSGYTPCLNGPCGICTFNDLEYTNKSIYNKFALGSRPNWESNLQLDSATALSRRFHFDPLCTTQMQANYVIFTQVMS